MTTTISSSVSSSEPGIELPNSLRPVTSKKVRAMIANRAVPDNTPQAISSVFFMTFLAIQGKEKRGPHGA